MDAIFLIVLVSYVLIIALLSYLFRADDSYIDFAIGNRRFGWFLTASGLFTLIGGGELIAGSAFGYSFGWYGVYLFIGYTISFIILGIRSSDLMSKIQYTDISYADYARHKYGPKAGLIVIISQLVAFFALIVLQFSAGATIIEKSLDISYHSSILLCALSVSFYLYIGGFRSVTITDVFQGIIMFLMIILVIYLAYNISNKGAYDNISKYPGFDSSYGILISGILIGLASADVWQRLVASRSPSEARLGFVVGGLILGAYGALIVYIGILAKASGVSPDENPFLSVLTMNLPYWVMLCATFASLAAILSTADTEIFLVSSLVERLTQKRWSTLNVDSPFRKKHIIIITALAAFCALYGKDLANFYNWMFVLYMIVAPTIALGVFKQISERFFIFSCASTFILFISLYSINYLNLENSYLLAGPATVVFFLQLLVNFFRSRRG